MAKIPKISASLPLLLVLVWAVDAGIPVPEEFFSQKVDHLSNSTDTWFQRYYAYGKYFKGPGHPVFLILGGEGGIPPERGIAYPFVGDHLAKTFGAFVLQPEHRFYGKSQPLENHTSAAEDPRAEVFTPIQALHDAMALLDHYKNDLGCSVSKYDDGYCPVVTFGGSYPGFLSAFARIVFPNKVDMAYAASAPMKFYAQITPSNEYYDHISRVAENTMETCSSHVNTTLSVIYERILNSKTLDDLKEAAAAVGVCEGSIPDYILEAEDRNLRFAQELMMVVGYTFANDNMANYPPGKDTRLYKACETFCSGDKAHTEKVKALLTERLYHYGKGKSVRDRLPSVDNDSESSPTCWIMSGQLPTGPNATITGGDWSGDGIGSDGESWDFQTCTLLVEHIGFSDESMFPAREWTMDWLEDHCMARFGVKPRPHELVGKYFFDDLVAHNVTHILFTNGLNVCISWASDKDVRETSTSGEHQYASQLNHFVCFCTTVRSLSPLFTRFFVPRTILNPSRPANQKDGWSVSGIQSNLSDTLIALNFENGAHHSDLNGVGPIPEDTDDIKEGQKFATRLLGEWLAEFGSPQPSQKRTENLRGVADFNAVES